MGGLELNKIFASVVLAMLVMVAVNIMGNVLYYGSVEGKEIQIAAHGLGGDIAVADAGDSASDKVATVALLSDETIKDLLSNADASRGQVLFRKCTACHDERKGGIAKLGPNLWGVVGRQIASSGGFNYSKAMKSHSNNKWDYTALFAYLTKPKEYIKGTRMVFAGFKSNSEIADVIAYLNQHSDSPHKLK